MKPSAFSQAGWVLFGGTLVLLIGALVKFVPDPVPAKPVIAAQTATPPIDSLDDSAEATDDLPLPPNFPANLAQIVKLTRAGLKKDVILAYAQTSGEKYTLNADEIVYMHQVGVSEAVMAALVTQKSKPVPVAVMRPNAEPVHEAAAIDDADKPVVAQPQPVSVQTPTSPAPQLRPPTGSTAASFYDDLAPYGDWVQMPDSTWAWRPTVEQAVPNWRPYRDDGEWEFTDAGWYWQSSYPWGWAAFHYGGWYNEPARGWVWQPGNNWGPAWVTWRKTSSHFGWAPLPPGVSFNAEFAVQPNNLADYGFSPSSYTFVPIATFQSHNLAKHAVVGNQATTLLALSEAIGGKNRNIAISPEEVSAATRRPIRRLSLKDIGAPNGPGTGVGSQQLAVYRANMNKGVSNSTKSNR